MKIFDTHVHFWDLSLKKNSWLFNPTDSYFIGDYSPICTDFLPDDLIKSARNHDLEGVTFIQAGWDKSDNISETKWVDSLCEAVNFPIAIISYADLTDPNISQVLYSHAKSSARFKGIRQILNYHENSYFQGADKNYVLDKNFAFGLSKISELGLIFECQAYASQLEILLSIINKLSKLSKLSDFKIIIEHCGMPLWFDKKDINLWRDVLIKASKFPNIVMKLSGLDMFNKYLNKSFNKDNIIDFCITTFGVERCMFGSNFPVDFLYGEYENTLSPILSQGLSKSDLDLILFKNANNIYLK